MTTTPYDKDFARPDRVQDYAAWCRTQMASPDFAIVYKPQHDDCLKAIAKGDAEAEKAAKAAAEKQARVDEAQAKFDTHIAALDTVPLPDAVQLFGSLNIPFVASFDTNAKVEEAANKRLRPRLDAVIAQLA